jgi:isopenicillin-N N-acyltransferase-like protein
MSSTRPAGRYREIEVSGTPREIGRQIGEAAREEILGFLDVARRRIDEMMSVSCDEALNVARDCIPFAADYAPHLLEELQGTAEAAGISLEEVMLLQVRNQLHWKADAGCTSLSLAAHQTPARRILAQNWDNDPALDPFTVVLTRRPAGNPAFMTVTQAGLIAYIGLSEAGMGVCLNTLPAPSRRVGVPHYFTVRGIYEATSLDGAVHAVERAQRAIPANIMLTTPDGPADLEVTIDEVRVLRDDSGLGGVTHTNHCQHPDFVPINADFPELIQSHPRKRRIDALLDLEHTDPAVERVQQALCDHDAYPRSICRHANDDPETGEWVTVFSVVIDVEAGAMHVSRGTPCHHPYKSYRL